MFFKKRKNQELYATQVESFRDLVLGGGKWLNKHSNKNYGPFPGELPLELKGNSVFLGLLFPLTFDCLFLGWKFLYFLLPILKSLFKVNYLCKSKCKRKKSLQFILPIGCRVLVRVVKG